MNAELKEMIEKLDHKREDICKCPFCGEKESLYTALETFDPFSDAGYPAECPSCEKEYTVLLTTKIWCQTSKP